MGGSGDGEAWTSIYRASDQVSGFSFSICYSFQTNRSRCIFLPFVNRGVKYLVVGMGLPSPLTVLSRVQFNRMLSFDEAATKHREQAAADLTNSDTSQTRGTDGACDSPDHD